jgi:glycosyltransferase involved in cell wall biosynthesis
VISPLDKLITRFVDSIVVLDNRIKKIASLYYQKNTAVIRSGVDLDRIRIESDYIRLMNRKLKIRKKGDFIFLSVAIFFPHRRFEDLINAFARLSKEYKNVKLIIIGSDRFSPTYADKIRRLVQQKKLSKSVRIFSDFVDHKMLLALYNLCDVFVFPSERQTWGLVVLEAMAIGKPCIVSKGAGVSEVLNDGENALLFTPRNVKGLISKMRFAVENKTKLEQIGKAGKELVSRNYTFERYAKQMYSLFRKVKLQENG